MGPCNNKHGPFTLPLFFAIYAVILSTPALWNTIPDKMISRFTILYYPFSSNSLTDRNSSGLGFFFYQTLRPTRRIVSRQINYICLLLQCIVEAPWPLLNSCPDGDRREESTSEYHTGGVTGVIHTEEGRVTRHWPRR